MSKIVYILGAGFSIPYGIPAQKDIMKNWFDDEEFLKEMKAALLSDFLIIIFVKISCKDRCFKWIWEKKLKNAFVA